MPTDFAELWKRSAILFNTASTCLSLHHDNMMLLTSSKKRVCSFVQTFVPKFKDIYANAYLSFNRRKTSTALLSFYLT